MRKVGLIGTLSAIMTFAAALAAPAGASDINIKLAHVDPADWQTSKKGAASEAFKNIVEAESEGRMSVQLFPAGALGGETDLVQSVQDGTLTMTMVSGAFSKVCPEAAVLDIPYMFSSAPIAWKVLDGAFGDELAEHCLKKTGLRTLAYAETGFRNFTNSKRPIREPKDVVGLKIRVMTVPLFVEMVKALGGEPTPIPWPEVPTALGTKVVDGQENPVSVIYSNKFYELQKYLTLDRHVYGADFILVNDGFYQKLSAEEKTMLRRAAIVAGNVGRAIQQFNSAVGVSKLIEKGMEVSKPNAAQMAEFREKSQPAVVKWLETQIDKTWIDKLQQAVAAAEKAL